MMGNYNRLAKKKYNSTFERTVISKSYISLGISLELIESLFEKSNHIIQDNRNTLKVVSIDSQKFVIKSFKQPNKLQGLIYRFFRSSKAKRSYDYSLKLNQLSIKTPEPVGYIEVYKGYKLTKSYFISCLLDYDFLIDNALNDSHIDSQNILKEFTKFTFDMHKKGVKHLDYGIGNIAIKLTGGTYQFYLFDLNRMEFGRVSVKSGLENFSRMCKSKEKLEFFARQYSVLRNVNHKYAEDQISIASKKTEKYFDRKNKLKNLFKKNKFIPLEFYRWDHYSDQPYVIRERRIRKILKSYSYISNIKILLNFLLFPFLWITYLAKKRRNTSYLVDSIGLCVNLSNILNNRNELNVDDLKLLIDDLNIKNISIRIPLGDHKNFDKYFNFISQLSHLSIMVVILQDRSHINNPQLLQRNLLLIFERLKGIVFEYQIGNSVNRKKWGFLNIDEYFDFFKIAQDLKKEHFPDITLLGGNIIDFDLPFLTRALFNFKPIFFDKFSTQLYVDRRGAPENTQMGFDTYSKINVYHHLISKSRKCTNDLVISEVNWPLKNTGKWSPTAGDYEVGEKEQALYLIRYYLLMIASGKVFKCYMHQLIAPGYGLIDDVNGVLRKRDAYFCFKFLIETLQGAKTLNFSFNKNLYRLSLEKDNKFIEVLWVSEGSSIINNTSSGKIYNMRGETVLVEKDFRLDEIAGVVYQIHDKFNY